MDKPDGEPAFPQRAVVAGRGMSLRDYFAAQTLHGMCHQNMLVDCETDDECSLLVTNVAALSYRLADAMLVAREK